MITKLMGRAIQSLTSLILILISSPVALANPTEITAVQIAPDFTSITITSEGPLGKHSAFVIDRPYRLVVDFEETGLGKLQGKIRVDNGPMNEIRLGYHNNRARVVVDFGENAVPPFQIERNNNLAVIALGKVSGPPRASAPKSRPVAKPTPVRSQDLPTHPDPSKTEVAPTRPAPARSESSALQSSRQGTDDSTVSVKEAGVRNNLVFVELVNLKDPKLTYRMIVDLDVDELSIRSASLSDSKGNLKKFEFLKSENELISRSNRENRVAMGPRKHSVVAGSVGAKAPKYDWSESSIEMGKMPVRGTRTGWPLRIEEFRLQSISADR